MSPEVSRLLEELQKQLTRIDTRLTQLEKKHRDHKHTGLDSKEVDFELENQGALTATDTSVIDATYGAEELAVLGNCRTRINEIEVALRNINVLT